MKTIHKYPIELDYEHKVTVRMPFVAKIVLVGSQHDQAFLWAIVDSTSPLVERHFRLIGTGHPIPGGYDHVGSFVLNHGESTCHLFE